MPTGRDAIGRDEQGHRLGPGNRDVKKAYSLCPRSTQNLTSHPRQLRGLLNDLCGLRVIDGTTVSQVAFGPKRSAASALNIAIVSSSFVRKVFILSLLQR